MDYWNYTTNSYSRTRLGRTAASALHLDDMQPQHHLAPANPAIAFLSSCCMSITLTREQTIPHQHPHGPKPNTLALHPEPSCSAGQAPAKPQTPSTHADQHYPAAPRSQSSTANERQSTAYSSTPSCKPISNATNPSAERT